MAARVRGMHVSDRLFISAMIAEREQAVTRFVTRSAVFEQLRTAGRARVRIIRLVGTGRNEGTGFGTFPCPERVVLGSTHDGIVANGTAMSLIGLTITLDQQLHVRTCDPFQHPDKKEVLRSLTVD